ncbi:MAG: FtsQ-type POTRA domain-containing protein [Patescibacteria group bacterium]
MRPFIYSQIKRRKKNRFILIRSSNEERHRKDFDWRPRKRNPYAKDGGIDWPRRIKLGLIIATSLAIGLLVVYHPFFQINEFNITGLQRIDSNEFRDALEGMIDYRKFFILPAKSYILADVSGVRDMILSRFPVETAIVQKVFPKRLNVAVQEKISTIIYDNGKQYSYLGAEGKIVEIIRNVGEDEWVVNKQNVTTTLADGTIKISEEEIGRYHLPPVKDIISEMGDYPIVYDARAKEGAVNDAMLRPETARGIIEWFNLIDKRTDILIGYILLENELGDALIKTEEGWEMLIKLNWRIEEQFEDLQYVLREKATRTNLNYIDLRYKDRVYWQ